VKLNRVLPLGGKIVGINIFFGLLAFVLVRLYKSAWHEGGRLWTKDDPKWIRLIYLRSVAVIVFAENVLAMVACFLEGNYWLLPIASLMMFMFIVLFEHHRALYQCHRDELLTRIMKDWREREPQ
jgi:hypothetical protein